MKYSLAGVTLVMDETKLFIDLGLSIGVGLLVGLQRERAGSAIAGIRTFSLISLGGAVAASLPPQIAPWAVFGGLIAVSMLCVVGNWTRVKEDESPGVTTEAAMLLMFLVGALIVFGPRSAGVAVGAAVAVLLHVKPFLHAFTKQLGDNDIRAIMQFAVITLIILPVAPDQAYDPYGVLNLRRIWLMVVLIVGISLAAYIAYRLLGQRQGAIIASVLGGLISSTATTASFSRRVRADPASSPIATVAILIASTILGFRLLVILWVTARDQWSTLATPVFILIAVGAGSILIARLRVTQDSSTTPIQENPTQLKSALIFAGLFALVLLASAFATEHFGQTGTFVVALISGLTDMDAITLSLGSQVHKGTISTSTCASAIMVAFVSNTVFKTAMAGTLGGAELLRRLLPYIIVHVLVAAGVIVWIQST